mmetsp:Transcript_19490/g.31561  ORF Transcript_19490/g.31561 Transcript_19490/m.31561 type:complete len:281 (+) Transcript_19490:49-891(+)
MLTSAALSSPCSTPAVLRHRRKLHVSGPRSTAVVPPAMAPKTLVTFDVDGTLIHSVGNNANKFHKDAFAFAFKKVFNLDTNIDVIHHHGSTDQLVAADVLAFHGISKEEIWANMPATCTAMLEHAAGAEDNAAAGLELLPGVERLLQTLAARDDTVVALVTGNLEPIAWTKMRRLGIYQHFTAPGIGGFGSDHTLRGELVKIAADRCAKELGVEVGPRFHVGDTPNDVIAAEFAGAVALGVTTGIFSKEELEASATEKEKCVVLDGLNDLDAVLKAFQLA